MPLRKHVVRTILFDRSDAIRQCLVEVVGPDHRLVAASWNGTVPLPTTAPLMADVFVVDIDHSGNLNLVNQLLEQFPSVPIIVFTWHDDSETIRKALDTGVMDYLIKGETGAEELIDAILAVAEPCTLH